MESSILIDVTKMLPSEKHPSIFNAFDSIEPGASVIIHNDHDPKPVYYQLLGLRGNCFTWSYLKNGPDVWEVEIKKNEPSNGKETIGQIVSGDIRKAEVFKKMGIDFCCGGKKTLEQACKEKGLSEAAVREALEAQHEQGFLNLDFNSWKPSFLADFITNQHHTFVRENTPILRELSAKVSIKHGDKYPYMKTVNEKLNELLNELETHMKKEEYILFPYIRQIEATKLKAEAFNSVQDPIWMMEQEHDIAGELIHEINALCNNYEEPVDACNSHKLLLYKLEEFENDLYQHIHLENNILFPKALDLEKMM